MDHTVSVLIAQGLLLRTSERAWLARTLGRLQDARVIPTLWSLLHEPGPERMWAAVALARLSEPQHLLNLGQQDRQALVDGLLAALSGDPDDATAGTTALVALGPEPLMDRVKRDIDTPYRTALGDCLPGGIEMVFRRIGLSAAASVSELIKHQDREARQFAIRVLGKLIHDACGRLAQAADNDQDHRVSEQAVATLGDITSVCLDGLRAIGDRNIAYASQLAAQLLRNISSESR